ncbi:MAG: mechanosensitive ion channel [Paraprevotella sp.]|nr:mechanosensitive ion channel [Paraprevotella sp.]
MIQLLDVTFPVDSVAQVLIADGQHPERIQQLIQQLINWGVEAGKSILAATLIFIIGRFIISIINKMVRRILIRHNVEPSIRTFIRSFVNILLTVMLIVSIVSALGVNTTSFAALLASAGVAIGMALSGNLQNLAGGLIILLFKPYKVGDYIDAESASGTVKEIQIFHTILTTPDNKEIYVPNGALSSGAVTNYNRNDTRRLSWTISIEYGEDVEKVKKVLTDLVLADERVLKDPAPFVALQALSASSVDILLRAWVASSDYWAVNFDMNQRIYEEFNKQGIEFPFPQLTIHQN